MVIIIIFEFNNRELCPTAGYLQISKPDYPFRLKELNQRITNTLYLQERY